MGVGANSYAVLPTRGFLFYDRGFAFPHFLSVAITRVILARPLGWWTSVAVWLLHRRALLVAQAVVVALSCPVVEKVGVGQPVPGSTR